MVCRALLIQSHFNFIEIMKLNQLETGDRFKLVTKRHFLRHHVYKVESKTTEIISYSFAAPDLYKSVTHSIGDFEIIKL
jgi:hypothetical protein